MSGVDGSSGSYDGSYDAGGYDEETVALAAAIRAPWSLPPAQPYAPAPPASHQPSNQPRPGPPAWPAPAPGAFYPPRPIGYVPMPIYAYPAPGWAPAPYVRVSQRELGVAYLLWFFLGVLGVHHFYLGNILRGLLYLFTLGFLGVGVLVDLFLLPSLTRRRNAEAIGRQYLPLPR